MQPRTAINVLFYDVAVCLKDLLPLTLQSFSNERPGGQKETMKLNESNSPEFTDEELYEGVINDFEDFEPSDSTTFPFNQGFQLADRSAIFTAIEIEKFVKSISAGATTGFKENGSFQHHSWTNATYPNWDAEPLGYEYYLKLGQFASVYNPVVVHSPEVTLFFETFMELGLGTFHLPVDPNQLISSNQEWAQGAFLFNVLVKKILEKLKSETFKNKQLARIQQARNNIESCNNYIESLFKFKTKRFFAIRIDLGYQPQFRNHILLHTARSDMERLLNNGQNNVFNRKIGYIRKLEYGLKKTYHFHVIFLFDESAGFNEAQKAYEIGEYWRNVITKGAGAWYDCSQSKNRFKRLAIGLISHDDIVTKSDLLCGISYLCKSEQLIKVRVDGTRVKSIIRGIEPKAKPGKAGRPSKKIKLNEPSQPEQHPFVSPFKITNFI